MIDEETPASLRLRAADLLELAGTVQEPRIQTELRELALYYLDRAKTLERMADPLPRRSA